MNIKNALTEIKKNATANAVAKSKNVNLEASFRLPNYIWKSENEQCELPVVLFRVKNSGRNHNVVLTIKDSKLYIWCGDKYCRENLGYEESYCYNWKNRNKICHHIVAVIDYLLDNDKERESVENFLATNTNTKKRKEGSKQEKSNFELAWELKLPVLLYGVTGSGKTHQVLEFVEKLQKSEDVEFFQINMSSGLEDTDLLTKLLPSEDGKGWVRVDGELTRAFRVAQKKPVIILLEELTRSSKSARNLILKVMDSVSGGYELRNFVSGEVIKVPRENILWIATANIGYSDTETLDPALARRFLITIFVDYDREKELEILKSILDEKSAVAIYEKIVIPLRKAYQNEELPYPIDTGTLKTFGLLYAKTKNLLRSAELSFMYRIVDIDATGTPDKEQIEFIKHLVQAVELEL